VISDATAVVHLGASIALEIAPDAQEPAEVGLHSAVVKEPDSEARMTGLWTTSEGWVSTYPLSHFPGQVK
jgi:hypothetical protein